MKSFIVYARGGRFNNDSGEEVKFANVYVLHHENINEDLEKGQIPVKMKTSMSVIRGLTTLPAMYDCEFMPSTKGTDLVSATLVKT